MTQMKFMFYILCLLGMGLVSSCDRRGDIAEGQLLPLTFSTSVAETRIGEQTTANLASMGVFAYFTSGGNLATTSTPNYMCNQKVTKSANVWTYTPLLYWPVNTADKVSFFAYSPHSDVIKSGGDDVTEMSSTTTAGYPSLTFVNHTAQTDLLIATPILNKNGGEVNFTFKHALAKVSFYIKNGDNTAGKKLHAFSIQSRQSGKYTCNETGFTYSAVGTAMRQYAITNAPIEIPKNTTDKVSLGTFYIHPDAETTISMIYSINGNDANTVEVVSQKLSATPGLVSGLNIGYVISLNKDGHTIKASNATEWTPGSTNTITYYEAKNLKVGDYYYSDGSTSDGGVRMIETLTKKIILADPLPQPVAGKTCIGIVFHIGAGPGDAVEDYADRSMDKIRGYVIALKDASTRIAWGNGGTMFGTSTNTGDFKGYSNTQKVIENTTISSPAFNSAYNYASGATPSAPATSSGWYYPSAAQLSTACQVWDALNFPLAGGYYPTLGSNWRTSYSSSSERDSNTMWRVYMGRLSGGILDYTKGSSMYVRSVLTF